MFTAYILFSATLNRFYIGYTSSSIEERLRKYLSNHNGFTGKAKDWTIKYTETFVNKELAMQKKNNSKAGRANNV